ncbi:WXG100 family type VII secretion target [Kitasatospora sp. MAA4]|uniref:WXG100 family type VII secretion target n=1 Tax=Kitasatospora sp. MAA4 TaxID=3035093 RepID=UPI0024732210|nr:WXG100 family type VII secretion target [Kitasatospora sp. MAA4]
MPTEAPGTTQKGHTMANLNVTYQEMSDAATTMSNNKADIDDKLNQCRTIVDNLTTNGFVTEQASGKFDEVHTEFNTSATQAMETLAQLSDWLNKAVAAMRDMDTQLSSSLNK